MRERDLKIKSENCIKIIFFIKPNTRLSEIIIVAEIFNFDKILKPITISQIQTKM
jgi:hypothetical protein